MPCLAIEYELIWVDTCGIRETGAGRYGDESDDPSDRAHNGERACCLGECGWHCDSSCWGGGERHSQDLGVTELFQGALLSRRAFGTARFETLRR